MDARIKKTCPSCSQPFSLKSHQQKCRLPLLLSCSHSICEVCLKNMLNFIEPIECKICHREMELSQGTLMLTKTNLYSVFPVDIYLLGELTLQTMENISANEVDNEPYIDLKKILSECDIKKSSCAECHGQTSKMCKQCGTLLCEECFKKTHKFQVFNGHVLTDIEIEIEPALCKIHKDKELDYYCKECSKFLCMHCMIVGGEKSCKNHDVCSALELNDDIFEELNEIFPKVDETFRRLTKTAVDIGHLLKNIENSDGDCELNKTKISIQRHFSKLHASIQKHEQHVMDMINRLKHSEKESLNKAKIDVANQLINTKKLLNKLNVILDPKTKTKGNYTAYLNEAKAIVKTPWYLNKDKDDGTQTPFKVVINEDLCSLVSDYVHLEGDANSAYKLQTTEEIGVEKLTPAPAKPVFPPEVERDVREVKVNKCKTIKPDHNKTKPNTFSIHPPQYRSKSGSTSSINSIGSDNSSCKRFGSAADSYKSSSTRVHSVSPFPETNQPKQLYEGSQEVIYISHIISPNDLFVQRACHQTVVREMLKEFRNASSWPKPSVNHVSEGKIYLALNKADQEWQRCRVVSVDRRNPNKLLYCVYSIDFGSTEIVTLNELRLLPAARLQSPPPLAIHCNLFNCVPKNREWTIEDAILIQKIIDNRQAVIYVRNIRSKSNFNVTLDVDVVIFDDGVSLAHALVFHDRAKLVDPKLQLPPSLTNHIQRPRIFSNNDFRMKTVEDVFITHIVSPDKFFVRKCHLQETYEKLCEDLDEEYSMATGGIVYYPEEGLVCVARVEVGGGGGSTWQRAVVRERPGRQRVRVELPDTGEQLMLHFTALRRIQHKFTQLNALCSECHLNGITPVNGKWSPKSLSLLSGRGPMRVHVEEIGRGRSVGVTLYCHQDGEDVCINAEMIRHKFAITIGICKFNMTTAVEEQVYTRKHPLEKPKESKPKKREVQILKRGQSPPKKVTTIIKSEELGAKNKGPLRLEVNILSCKSPSDIYLNLKDQQDAYKELYEKIQQYYSEHRVPSKSEWRVGDKCACFSTESKTWRRVIIMEIKDTTAKIFFTDFAKVATASIEELKELPPEFLNIAEGAIKCHLSGVVPANGNEWPSLTKEFLVELLEAYPRVFLTKRGSPRDGSLPAELWVYHVKQGGPLDPNTAEWRCLNKAIIQQGLGVPDKNQEEEYKPTDDNILSLFNITGSIEEWMKLEPPKVAPTSSQPNHNRPETPESVEDHVSDNEAKCSKTMLVTDWLPAEPLNSKEFTGVPTYIDNDGVIYLHDISQRDTLELIRKALDVRFTDDRSTNYTRWQVGQPCIARFYLDGLFYRGRILEVNKDTSKCIIHYVDYGNEEWCSFEDMRKTIVLYQIPIQAHKCILGKIKPVNGAWNRITLDYVHKSIVEKECFVKVTGEEVGGFVPVCIKFDKLYINDLLVDLEMAVYMDGSKPLVTKYLSRRPAAVVEVPPPSHSPDYIVDDTTEPDYIVDDTTEPDYIVDESTGPDYIVDESTGPDYIVDEEGDTDTLAVVNESIDQKSIEQLDWNVMVELEEEEMKAVTGPCLTFPEIDFEECECNLILINKTKVELNIVQNEETKAIYEKMFDEIQNVAQQCSPINGVYGNKACLALYQDDGLWYRAAILEYSNSENLVKVYYVDFGNTEVISLADLREIPEELTTLPPRTISARLFAVDVAPGVDAETVTEAFTKTFLVDHPFKAKIVKRPCDTHLFVELRDRNGDLVYNKLIESGILIMADI